MHRRHSQDSTSRSKREKVFYPRRLRETKEGGASCKEGYRPERKKNKTNEFSLFLDSFILCFPLSFPPVLPTVLPTPGRQPRGLDRLRGPTLSLLAHACPQLGMKSNNQNDFESNPNRVLTCASRPGNGHPLQLLLRVDRPGPNEAEVTISTRSFEGQHFGAPGVCCVMETDYV